MTYDAFLVPGNGVRRTISVSEFQSMTDNPFKPRTNELAGEGAPALLPGVPVLEFAVDAAEYCGLLLAGLGAEVTKLEEPGGSPTRWIAPFLKDKPHAESSLYFWAYNRGKRSVIVNFEREDERERLLARLGSADILLDSSNGRLN